MKLGVVVTSVVSEPLLDRGGVLGRSWLVLLRGSWCTLEGGEGEGTSVSSKRKGEVSPSDSSLNAVRRD